MSHKFVVVVNVILPICCHIGWGMPHILCIFVEDILAALGALSDKVGMKTGLWSELDSKQ